MPHYWGVWLASSVEDATLDPGVINSSHTLGVEITLEKKKREKEFPIIRKYTLKYLGIKSHNVGNSLWNALENVYTHTQRGREKTTQLMANEAEC